MAFVQPWMLVFGVVALVPLLLHLIGRQRARTVHFSALAFLLANDPKRARALRIEQRSLLLLRMAVAALLAVALAGPLLPTWGHDPRLSLGGSPVAVVVVLDDSLSMQTTHEGRSRFDRARSAAVELLTTLPPGSRAAVVLSGRPARALQPRLSDDVRSVIAALAQVSGSARPDDGNHALALARRLLDSAPAPQRRTVLLSDLQVSGWADVKLDAPHLRVVPIGTAVDDIAVDDVVVEPGLAEGPQHARVRVTLRRQGSTPWDGLLRLRVGQRELRSRIHVDAGASASHVFVVPTVDPLAVITATTQSDQPDQPDQHDQHENPGKSAFSRKDGLIENNQRWLRLSHGSTLQVLIIDGSPRPVQREGEVFFLVKALQASALRSDELRLDVRRPDQLSAETPPTWDVLVLANLSELSGAQIALINAHVSAGAGLLITMGDQVPSPAGTWLKGILPVEIAGMSRGRPTKLRADRSTDQNGLRALRQRFAADILPTVANATIARHRLVRPSPQLRNWIALRYEDGSPALLVAPHGKGRVAVWTTTIDRDWTDLPLHPGWLPLARQLVRAVAARSATIDRLDVEVGQAVIMARRPDAVRLQVRYGGETLQTLTALRQPSGLWRIADLLKPGVWQLREEAPTGIRQRTVIIRPPMAESEPALRTPADVQGHHGDPAAIPTASTAAPTPKVPAWSFALAGLFIVLLSEAVLLRRAT